MGASADAKQLPTLDLDEPRGELKAWSPKKFNRRHHLILHMHSVGYKNNEIAERLGMCESRISTIINDPRAPSMLRAFAERVADEFDDVHVRLRLVAPDALKTAISVMQTTQDEKVARDTAFGLLDRAGYGKIDKQIKLHAPLSEAHVERLTKGLSTQDDMEIPAYYVKVEDESDE